MNPSEGIFDYHDRTKHQLYAYAKGPESLDWEDQPDPFRRFAGSETLDLPKPGMEFPCLFEELDKPESIEARPLTLPHLGLLLELSFGLSAWKQFGPDRWSLRCNPSSGNLHPTEAYVICTDARLMRPGVYHYVSHDHQLERRCTLAAEPAPGEVYLGLSSVHWREAWKYGERAFRYCQLDIGHALAALAYAAACLGWSLELLSETSDTDIAGWLGLDRHEDFIAEEHESPDLICRLHAGPKTAASFDAAGLSQILQSAQWSGTAQPLSGRHFYHWPIIDSISAQAIKPSSTMERWQAPHKELPSPRQSIPAGRLIRQRRSAQSFNGKAEDLPLADFHRMMMALLPNAKPPFNAWNWPPQTHLILYVHRVAELQPGIYCLPRETEALHHLQQAMSADFNWQKIKAPFEFYQLAEGNARQIAKTLSCHQPIASDSAFSLSILVRFEENIQTEAWRYRRLFWECGMLGQALYLEAEAAGVRGTGIGCFFDDEVHELLGLKDQQWQSLYHFTVGQPLEDSRLQSLPAYEHLKL